VAGASSQDLTLRSDELGLAFKTTIEMNSITRHFGLLQDFI
jgi:hypothetical protein